MMHTLRRVWNLGSLLLRWMMKDTSEDRSCGQVFLILGGARVRELECARMIKEFVDRNRQADVVRSLPPPLLVLLSSGSASLTQVAEASGTNPSCTRLDYRAVDTLTNFTTLASDLARSGCTSVTVATSQAHMCRAYPLAVLVLGSHGIRVSQLACPDSFDRHAKDESTIRALRDFTRALVWIMFGWDGVSVSAIFHPERQRAAQEASASTTTQLPWPSFLSPRPSSVKGS